MTGRGKTVHVYLPQGRADSLRVLERPFVACRVLLAHEGAVPALLKRPEVDGQGVFLMNAGEHVRASYFPDGAGAAARAQVADAGGAKWAAYVQITGHHHVRTSKECLQVLAHHLRTTGGRREDPPALSEAEAAATDELLAEVRLLLAVGGA